VVSTLVPEGVEERLVATSPGVGDEVEEQGNEEFEGEGAATGEVLLALSENAGFDAGQELGECSKIVSDFAGTGMGIADRILCRSCWISRCLLLFHEHRSVQGRCSHSITIRILDSAQSPSDIRCE
jgi:hypothetical protein